MNWRGWPYWMKGGIIGLITSILVFLIYTFYVVAKSCNKINLLVPEQIDCGLSVILFTGLKFIWSASSLQSFGGPLYFAFMIIVLLVGSLLGAIIGWIVGKIKSR